MKKSIPSLSLMFALAAAGPITPCAAQNPTPTTAPQANAPQANAPQANATQTNAPQAGTAPKMSPEELRQAVQNLLRGSIGMHHKYRTPEEVAKSEARIKKFNTLNNIGLDAVRAQDYAGAETYFRAALEVQPQSTTETDLALMLDYQGKTEEAFDQYKKTFGSPFDSTFSARGLDEAEAMLRYGIMCADRGQQAVAVQAYGKAWEGFPYSYVDKLDKTLDAQTAASPALTRTMLDILLGTTLLAAKTQTEQDRSAEAVAVLERAAKRTPGSAVAQVSLANGLLAAGRYSECEAALKKVRTLDRDGTLKAYRMLVHNELMIAPGYTQERQPQVTDLETLTKLGF